MVETRHDTTKSIHCCDVGALFLKPSHRQGMQRSYETYSNRTWPFCQSNCTLVSPGIEMINHIYFWPNNRRKQRGFARVGLRAAMFSFPLCVAGGSSGRLFHDLSRNHAGHQTTNSCFFFVSCCVIVYLVRPGANFRWRQMLVHRIKRSC